MAKAHQGDRKGQKRDSEWEEEVLAIDRVTRVVAGGRRLRFRASVVIGNKNGKVGLGVGKANEVVIAIDKAIRQAKKNLILVKTIKDTIPHSISHKYKSAKLLLMPASEGTGIIAGGAIRKVIELAGIKNILSKSLGSSNKIALARATLEALGQFNFKVDVKMAKMPKVEVKAEAPKAYVADEMKKTDKNAVSRPSHKSAPKPAPKAPAKK